MHCYICVTYLMIICSAHPPKFRESYKTIEKRSLFHDVIESLRIRAQLPEITNSNEDNNIGHISDRFGYDNDLLQLPNDSEFIPRRNDRIEMPSLKYRMPKSLTLNEGNADKDDPNEEIILYVNTPNDDEGPESTTQRPKKQKRPINNANSNKHKDNGANIPDAGLEKPFTNSMAGQSQIGNRESQTVVKPTVIVNFRGSVHHRDSDIRLERRNNDNDTNAIIPQNIFNIKQEIKLDKSDAWMGSTGSAQKQPVKKKPGATTTSEQSQPRIEEDMMMCETGWKQNNEGSRKHDILQIFLNV